MRPSTRIASWTVRASPGDEPDPACRAGDFRIASAPSAWRRRMARAAHDISVSRPVSTFVYSRCAAFAAETVVRLGDDAPLRNAQQRTRPGAVLYHRVRHDVVVLRFSTSKHRRRTRCGRPAGRDCLQPRSTAPPVGQQVRIAMQLRFGFPSRVLVDRGSWNREPAHAAPAKSTGLQIAAVADADHGDRILVDARLAEVDSRKRRRRRRSSARLTVAISGRSRGRAQVEVTQTGRPAASLARARSCTWLLPIRTGDTPGNSRLPASAACLRVALSTRMPIRLKARMSYCLHRAKYLVICLTPGSMPRKETAQREAARRRRRPHASRRRAQPTSRSGVQRSDLRQADASATIRAPMWMRSSASRPQATS